MAFLGERPDFQGLRGSSRTLPVQLSALRANGRLTAPEHLPFSSTDGFPALAAETFAGLTTNGKQVCGDFTASVLRKGLSRSREFGRTLRAIEAPLTAEQRAQRAIEEEKRKVEEESAKSSAVRTRLCLTRMETQRTSKQCDCRAQEDVKSQSRRRGWHCRNTRAAQN